jgi:uncharacterized membrane protein
MSAYNILTCDIKCSQCKNHYQGQLQFKYGDTWQFTYEIGDKIKWGGNDIGLENKKVKVYGILESDKCPACREENKNSEYDIFVENGYISKVEPIESLEDYSENDGNYKVITV